MAGGHIDASGTIKAREPATPWRRRCFGTMADDKEKPPRPRRERQTPPPQYYSQFYSYPILPSYLPHHGGAQYPYQMAQGYVPLHPGAMDGIPLPPGLGGTVDPLESVLGPFPCVRLRGLPFDATLEDVLVFFQGLGVLDVVLKGSGDAFVVLGNTMDYQMALQRDRQLIRQQYIEVAPGKRAEYYAAIAAQQWQIEQQEKQLSALDDEEEAEEAGGFYSSSQSATLAALPQLPRAGALQGRRGGTMALPPGGPSVSIPTVRRTGGGIQVGEHTGYLRMRGLPFSASKTEIVEFFDGYNPIPESVVLTYRSDGRATGEGYLQFATPDDSKSAMILHRNTMGNRYIELFISNKEEHARAFARFGDRE